MSAMPVAAAKTPVVLLHGWGMHGGVWADLAARLGEYFEVLAPDLPGHGTAPPVEPYALDTLVDCVAAGAPPACVVAGWSLGGQLALRWAHRHPQQVRRLVLIGTTPRFVSAADWPHGIAAAVLDRFAAELTEDAAKTLRRFLLLETRGDAQSRAVARQLDAALGARPLPGRDVLTHTLSWLQTTDLRALLPDIVQPTLILHGDRDQITPAGAGPYLASRLGQARLEVIPGAAHAPFLSEPQQVSRLMTDFCHGR